jgi:hypothetical protein
VLRLVTRGTIDEMKYLRQLYKVQLKQETLRDAGASAPKAARMFRGVQGDKQRRGELFGTENLLKFKDGSFLDDVWKSIGNRSPPKKSGDGICFLETLKLANTLRGIGEERCDEIMEGGEDNDFISEAANQQLDSTTGGSESDQGPSNNNASQVETGDGGGGTANAQVANAPRRDSVGNAENHDNAGRQEGRRGAYQRLLGDVSSVEERARPAVQQDEEEESDLDIEANAVNHADLFNEYRGRAAIEQGEDGFDLELGADSQNFVDIIEQGIDIPENPQDGSYSDTEGQSMPNSPTRPASVPKPDAESSQARTAAVAGPNADISNSCHAMHDEDAEFFSSRKARILSKTIEQRPASSSRGHLQLEDVPKDSVADNSGSAEADNSETKAADGFGLDRAAANRKKSAKNSKTPSPQKVTPIVQIVGMPSLHIAQNKAMTTFSASDLSFLPSYTSKRSKKKKKKGMDSK